jgi:hypothetical protein
MESTLIFSKLWGYDLVLTKIWNSVRFRQIYEVMSNFAQMKGFFFWVKFMELCSILL